MAQLKSTIVSGDLSVTDSLNVTNTLYSNTARFFKILAKNSNGEFSLGEKNQILTSNGEEIYWQTLTPNISLTDGTSDKAPEINVTVGGKTGTPQSLTIATDEYYGVTKLINIYDSNDNELATTGQALSNAINSLNYEITSQTDKTLTNFKIENGKISTTFSDISINSSQISNVVPIEKGGTGLNHVTYNSILYVNESNDISTFPSKNGVLYSTADQASLSWGILPIAQGGTGATNAKDVKSNLGLGPFNLNFSVYDFPDQINYKWGIGATVQSSVGVDKQYANEEIFLIPTDNGLILRTENKEIWKFNITTESIIASVTPQEDDSDSELLNYKILYKDNNKNSVGSPSKPIYINQNGEAVACDNLLDLNISGNSATSDKLNTNAGNGEQPIYFNNGIPVQTSYYLKANIKDGSDNFLPEYTDNGRTLSEGNILKFSNINNDELNLENGYLADDFLEALIKYIPEKYTFKNNITNLIGSLIFPNKIFPGILIGNISKNINQYSNLPEYSTFIFHGPEGDLEVFGSSQEDGEALHYYHKTYLNNKNYKTWTVSHTGEKATGTWDINISGKAQTAINDEDGNQITSTYLKLIGGTMTSGAKIIIKSVGTASFDPTKYPSEASVKNYALTGGIELQNQDNQDHDNLTSNNDGNIAYAPGISFNWRGKYAKKLSLFQNKLYLDNKEILVDVARVDQGGTGATDAPTARNNLNVPSKDGSGAEGIWGISVNGFAKSLEPFSDISSQANLVTKYNSFPKEKLINFYYKNSSNDNDKYGVNYLGFLYNNENSTDQKYGSFLVLRYNILNFLEINNGSSTLHEIITNNQNQIFTGDKSWGSNGAGGLLNGGATNGGINSILIGDDVWLGDCNNPGILGIKSTGDNCGFYFYDNNKNRIGEFYCKLENGRYNFYSNKPLTVINRGLSSFINELTSKDAAVNIEYSGTFSPAYYYPWINQKSSNRVFSIGFKDKSLYILNISNKQDRGENWDDSIDYKWEFRDNGILYGNFNGKLTGNASSASTLTILEGNQEQNTAPSNYNNNLIFQGIKKNAFIDSPSTVTYSCLIGLRGNIESHELAFNNNGIYRRQGSGSNWNLVSWLHLLDSGNFTSYAVSKNGDTMTGDLIVNSSIYSSTIWANQGTGERQVGVTYNSGNLYFWGNSSSGTAGIYDTNGGYVIQRETTYNKYNSYFSRTEITNHLLCSTKTAGSAYNENGSAIQIREVGLVGTAQSDWIYAPKIGFHWGGRVAMQLGMDSNQWLCLYSNNSTTPGSMRLHNILLEGTTDATMSASSNNPRITFQEGTSSQPVHLIYTDYDSYRSPAGLKIIGGNDATPAWFEVEGSLYVSSSNTTGGGIILADDGDIVDLNDGYCSMRFSNGVRIFSGKRGGSAAITLASNGSMGLYGNIYPSINMQRTDAGETSIYLSNNTAGWSIGLNVWSIGAGGFGIGQYSGAGSSTWRFRIDNSGYCYTSSYLNLGGGHEGNASSPPYVWGLNGGDTFLRTYQTSSLSVNYANSAGSANYASDLYQGSGNWWSAKNFGYYHYEGADINTNRLPTSWAEILRWGSTNRGAAIAVDWRGGQGEIYVNNLHDDSGQGSFSGWKQLLRLVDVSSNVQSIKINGVPTSFGASLAISITDSSGTQKVLYFMPANSSQGKIRFYQGGSLQWTI